MKLIRDILLFLGTILPKPAQLTTAHPPLPSVSHRYPNHSLLFDRQSFDYTAITYGVVNLTDHRAAKSLKVYLEDLTTHRTRSCEVRIEVEDGSHVIDDYARVIKFGKDRSIVVTREVNDTEVRAKRNLVKFTIVDFSTNPGRVSATTLSMGEPTRPNHVYTPMTILCFEETFDVVFPVDAGDGERSTLMKVTFDSAGKMIEQIHGWFTIAAESLQTYVLPVDPTTSESGYVVVDQLDDDAKLVYLLRGGETKLLTNATLPSPANHRFVYSASFDALSLCYVNSDLFIDCLRFDNAELDTNDPTLLLSQLNFGSNVRLVDVHNSPLDAGFVLLTRKTSCATSDECAADRYHLTRIDDTGNAASTVKLTGVFRLDECFEEERGRPLLRVFYTQESGYCVAYACTREAPGDASAGFLHLDARCFKEVDFHGLKRD